jgi:Electron transfer DM13
MKKLAALLVSHGLALAVGFAAGVYVLPILIAPEPPASADIASAAGSAEFKTEFRRDLKGSDFLHWGEGIVSVGRKAITLQGRIAPGPDYKLYLVPEFVETKEAFERLKPGSLRVGDVKTFENFIVPLPDATDVTKYNTVVVWCESFSQFITAAKYR